MALEDRRKLYYMTAGLGLALVAYRYRQRLMEPLRKLRNPLSHRNVMIIENSDQCQQAVNLLKEHTARLSVLGFDVEWVTLAGKRRPCALLQLSSHKGLCALFRLCYMQQIPKSLRELLEDDTVMKVGVAPQDDAQKLSNDYGVGVASTFDLRFLAAMTGHKAEGLAKLSKSILNVQLDKNWRIACSDWEARILTDTQIRYAANDALVAVEIFKKLLRDLEPKNYWHVFMGKISKAHWERLESFFDLRFRDSYLPNLQTGDRASIESLSKVETAKRPKNNNVPSRGICTRSRIMYDNCFLQAPDGELLCTIDRRKAKWYVSQKLGTEVAGCETYTVRLNFEPAGRAVGEVGAYYQAPKENRCVVCGREDVYIRKNVVPREYRKHFPVVMKSHTSHDVLLLCPTCHQLSNISDLKVRRKLAEMCDAPLSNEDGAVKVVEIPEMKKLRSAARALLQSRNALPEKRRKELMNIVLEHFKADEDELTNEMLQETANIDVVDFNEDYQEHGQKVVQCFQTKLGGLIELERMWREHFLHTMQPQFLPQLWNVNHNADRLGIRAQEGRLEEEDLLISGLDLNVAKSQESLTKNSSSNESEA